MIPITGLVSRRTLVSGRPRTSGFPVKSSTDFYYSDFMAVEGDKTTDDYFGQGRFITLFDFARLQRLEVLTH